MRIYLLLILFLMLWDGGALVGAETVHKAAEGGNITVGCWFYFRGSKKIFCKNDCNKEDILVETSGNRERNGRYSIEYKEGSLLSSVMFVNITKLTWSDSGRYSCVLERTFLIDGKHEFRIEVTKDASLNPIFTLKPNDPPSPFTVKTTAGIPSFLTVTPTEQSLTQAPVSFKESTTAPSGAPSGVTLVVGLTLVAVLILLSAALMIFCWNKRANKPKEPPVNTEYAQITQPDRLYEEVQENNVQSSPRPVQVSTVYASASFNKTAVDPTSEIYSLATPPSSQLQAEKPSSQVLYSDLDFSQSSGPSLNGAPRSQTGQRVIYSAPRVQTEDTLYSTVSSPQP